MKFSLFPMFLSLAVVIIGCSTNRSMVKTKSTIPAKNPQMQAFFGFGSLIQKSSGIELTMSSDSIFRKKSSHLSKDGIREIDSIAATILKYPNDKVEVDCYTDNSSSEKKSLKFSQHRAESIKKELVKQGVDETKLVAVGKGSANPLLLNDNETDMAKNRRVEFEISIP